MKYKIISAVLVSAVCAIWGAHDSYEQIQKDARAEARVCSLNPQQGRCALRAELAENVRIVFNGKHGLGDTSTAYAANN